MIVPRNGRVLIYGISQNLQGRTEKNFNTGASEFRIEPDSSKIRSRIASYPTIIFRTMNQHESILYVCHRSRRKGHTVCDTVCCEKKFRILT